MSTITSTETNTAQAVFDSFIPVVRKYDYRTADGKFVKNLQNDESLTVEIGEVVVVDPNGVYDNENGWTEAPVKYKALKVTTKVAESEGTILLDLFEYLTKYTPTVKVTNEDYQKVEVPNVVRWVTERIFLESRTDERWGGLGGNWYAFKVRSASLVDGAVVITDETVLKSHRFSVSPLQREYDAKSAESLPAQYTVSARVQAKHNEEARGARTASLIAGAKASFVPSNNFEACKHYAEKFIKEGVNETIDGSWRTALDIAVDIETTTLLKKYLEALGSTDWETPYPEPLRSSYWTDRDESSVPTVIDEVTAYAITVANYVGVNRSLNDATPTIIGLVLAKFNKVLRRW